MPNQDLSIGYHRHRSIRRELAWLLAVKFGALFLLWWLFFSPAHRQPIDGRAVGERLAVTPTPSNTTAPDRQ